MRKSLFSTNFIKSKFPHQLLLMFAMVFSVNALARSINNLTSTSTSKLEDNKNSVKSAWSNQLTATQVQPMVKESKPATKLAYSLDYAFSESSSVAADLAYKYTWDQFEDQKPSRIDDMDLSLNNKWSQAELETFVTLPVSEVSIKESMRFGIGIKPSVFTDLGRNHFSFSQSVAYYNYEFETANKAGSRYNTQYSADTTLGYSFAMTKSQKISLNTGLLSTQDYDDHLDQAYFLSLRWGIALSKKISLFSLARTQDQVLTQKQIFDYDRSSFALGVNYVF